MAQSACVAKAPTIAGRHTCLDPVNLDLIAALARAPEPAPSPLGELAVPSYPEMTPAPDHDDAKAPAPARRRRVPGQRSSV